MTKSNQKFARLYLEALRNHLQANSEAGLEAAYRLGRQAVAARLGVLDMVRIYQQTLKILAPNKNPRHMAAAEEFLVETLSPFEVTHRGFRETNIRLVHLIETLEIRNRDLAALSNKIIHAQEEERKRVSRELHDQVSQALTAISVTLARLKPNGLSAKAKRTCDRAQSLLRDAMETVHNFARDLRPPMLDELGLLPALRSLTRTFAERTGVKTSFHSNPEAENLTEAQKTVLFRVAQESLSNVARHAKASHVDVAVRGTRHEICMTISDDGRSFRYRPAKAESIQNGLGIIGMVERVRLIHGNLHLIARINKGTMVQVTIPT